ncbi:MAG: hypothetical protein WAM29_06875 [Methylocella sp.]
MMDFPRGWTAKAPKVIVDNVVFATHAQGKFEGQSPAIGKCAKNTLKL